MTGTPKRPRAEAVIASDWEERIHGFLDPDNDKPEHYAAIGRLITAFNGIDVILNLILRHQLGADTKQGRAVIGGMRTIDMLTAIKRLAKINDMRPPQFKELENLDRDIRALKNLRDDVAHKVWAVSGDEMSFSNTHTSKFHDVADFTLLTIAELNDLARYAPYLTELSLDLFPGSVSRGSGPLPSRDKPLRLQSDGQSQDKTPRHG